MSHFDFVAKFANQQIGIGHVKPRLDHSQLVVEIRLAMRRVFGVIALSLGKKTGDMGGKTPVQLQLCSQCKFVA